MEASLMQKIAQICETLNDCDVEYLIVGGSAVALHGFFRMSMNASGEIAGKHDLDFWFNPSYTNYYKLLNAIEKLGQDVKEYRDAQTPEPIKSFFNIELEFFTLDFLPSIGGVENFREAYNNGDLIEFKDIEIPFISFEELILNKEHQGRPKDIRDIEELRKRRSSEDD